MICAAVERCAGMDVGKTVLSVCVMTESLDGEARMDRRIRDRHSGLNSRKSNVENHTRTLLRYDI